MSQTRYFATIMRHEHEAKPDLFVVNDAKGLIFCSIAVINNLFNFRFNLRLRELKLHLHSYFSTYN